MKSQNHNADESQGRLTAMRLITPLEHSIVWKDCFAGSNPAVCIEEWRIKTAILQSSKLKK